MSILPAAIMAGGAVLGSGIQAAGNIAGTGMANEANRKLWLEQTEYNKPSNQMARLREAGLNPALAYGKGVATNIAGSPPSMGAPNIPNPDPKIDFMQVRNVDLTNSNLIMQHKVLENQAKGVELDNADKAGILRMKQSVYDVTGIWPENTDPSYVRMLLKSVGATSANLNEDRTTPNPVTQPTPIGSPTPTIRQKVEAVDNYGN